MGCRVLKFTFVPSISVMKTANAEVSRLLSVVWDPEGLQPPETDGHPGEADAEDNQVLAATQGHPEAHGRRRLETQSWPDGKYSCRLSLVHRVPRGAVRSFIWLCKDIVLFPLY